jgi:hypothetical protein
MADPCSANQVVEFRKCANVKSKTHPDSPCKNTATNGDFCARHWKRPHRYVALTESRNTYVTRFCLQAIRRIQKWWRCKLSIHSFKQQGPAVNCYSLSQNTTEVYSMEPIEKVPKVFFFSYADAKKTIWAFDIRSLSHIMAQGKQPENPYTRETFSQESLQRLRERISYLRKRKYPVMYLQGESLSNEQEWNQRVLDIFMKLEALGYLAACSWFNRLTINEHKEFYKAMFQLWNWRLGLSPAEKEAIMPGHLKAATKLFRWIPDAIQTMTHNHRWWQKQSLALIETFIERSQDKTKNALGALYVIMGLVHVSEEAAEAYPWIAETLDE